MNEFIEQLHKDLIKKAKESMDGHYAMIGPFIIDWRHIESALKESYTKGVEDKNNLMRDYENLLIDIMGKRKVSIGSLENYYDLHLEVESIDKQYSRLQQLKEK